MTQQINFGLNRLTVTQEDNPTTLPMLRCLDHLKETKAAETCHVISVSLRERAAGVCIATPSGGPRQKAGGGRDRETTYLTHMRSLPDLKERVIGIAMTTTGGAELIHPKDGA